MKNKSILKKIPDDIIEEYFNRFKNDYPIVFEAWKSIEKKDHEIEMGELEPVSAEIYRFIKKISDYSDHLDFLSIWAGMRSLIRTRELGLPIHFRSTNND